jgi:hypothetical protein
MEVGIQRQSRAALPPGKIRYPLYRRLDKHLGRSGRMRNISLPPGFDPQTVHGVASRYTDCAIPVHYVFYTKRFFLNSINISVFIGQMERFLRDGNRISKYCVYR